MNVQEQIKEYITSQTMYWTDSLFLYLFRFDRRLNFCGNKRLLLFMDWFDINIGDRF